MTFRLRQTGVRVGEADATGWLGQSPKTSGRLLVGAAAASSFAFGCAAFFDFSDIDKAVQSLPDGSADTGGIDGSRPDADHPAADAAEDATDAGSGFVCKGVFGLPMPV